MHTSHSGYCEEKSNFDAIHLRCAAGMGSDRSAPLKLVDNVKPWHKSFINKGSKNAGTLLMLRIFK